ncbi:MAG: aspartyl protease family protein [Candidatus Eremiobacteraeota bacterium]|nr:aspartyl protease family protein [Candidatus Eremiobacteraeota bacterium]MBC5821627.1 aspartyl protease family protein [Candidatus Eremiobacteraeota bacterium]
MHFRIASLVVVGLFTGVGATARTAASPGLGPPGPTTPATAAILGDRLFAAADFGGAERAYRSALRNDRHNAAAELGLARIALYRNELGEAERHARALAADDPSDPRANGLRRSIAERRDEGPDYRVTITDAQVDVPFRIDPLPEFEALVDGKRAHLLLDTGGPGLTLGSSFAKALGVATRPGGEGVFAGGLRGAIRSGHVDRLDLGGASIRSLPMSVAGVPPGIDGALGTNVLYRFLSTIDYANRRLVLRRKTESKTFNAGASARGAAIVPMLLVPDHFIFARARVGDAPEALFSVDTGGAGVGVQLTKTELHAAAIVPDSSHPTNFVGGGGAVRTLPFAADVTLGRRTFRQVPGVYSPDGDPFGTFPFSIAGAISQELFKRGALTFDFSAMKLIFEVPKPLATSRTRRFCSVESPKGVQQSAKCSQAFLAVSSRVGHHRVRATSCR